MADHDVTKLLQQWANGDSQAFDQLIELVDGELRRLARSYMNKERKGQTLQTTALINEAVIRLIKGNKITWESRLQFYSIAARRMRQVLVEHAREQLAEKRGARAPHVTLSEAGHLSSEKSEELLFLDAALTKFAKLDLRKATIVEYRYFGGFTVPEIAEMLGISITTVEREWRLARTWLLKELGPSEN